METCSAMVVTREMEIPTPNTHGLSKTMGNSGYWRRGAQVRTMLVGMWDGVATLGNNQALSEQQTWS